MSSFPFLLAALLVSTPAHDGLHKKLELLSQRIAHSPKSAELYLQRAEVFRQHDEFDRARRDLEHVARLEAELPALPLARARLEHSAGNLERALMELEGILARDPDDLGALRLSAEVHERRGAHEKALGFYDRVITLAKAPQPDLFLARASASMARGSGFFEDAIAGLDRAMERIGPAISLQLRAIELECERFGYDRALDRLDRLRAPFSRQEGWLAQRGDILRLAERHAEALVAYRAALLALEKLRRSTRRTASMVALEGRVRSAIRALERAREKRRDEAHR